jgi:hypothetical protein
MQDAIHIKAFRLFDQAHTQSLGKDFELLDWEQAHFRQCAECQAVFAIFARQLRLRLPAIFSNGEISPTDAWYKTLCCELQSYIPAGTVFPDCPRHKKLPTVWRLVREESSDESKKTSAGD